MVQRAKKYVTDHPYKSTWLVSSLYFGFLSSWMFGLKTAELAQGPGVGVVAGSAAIIIACSLAVGPVLFVYLINKLRIGAGHHWFVLWVMLLWPLSEYIRALLFSFIAAGPGSSIGPFWTQGNIGYFASHTPVLYAARFGGLYLLSALTVGFVASVYIAVYKRTYMSLGLVLIGSLILSASGYVLWSKPSGQSKTVTALHFLPTKQSDGFSKKVRASVKNIAKKSDIVVMPEYSEVWKFNPEYDTPTMQRLARDKETVFIDSARGKTNDAFGYNYLEIHDSSGNILASQAKRFLIPGGEYVPYIYQLILAYTGQDSLIRNFRNQKIVRKGLVPEQPLRINEVSYGSFACSGVLSPEAYRSMANNGANIFTNSASLDTLGIGTSYHTQAYAMARLHAVANARPFIQSAKGGPSYIIDSNGNELAYNNSNEDYSYIQSDLTINHRKTLYTMFGDWIVWLGLLSICLVGFARLTRYKKNHKLALKGIKNGKKTKIKTKTSSRTQ